MKKIIFALTAFAFASLISCGPNAEEKAKQQKVHDDSLVNAAISEKEKQDDSEISDKISALQTKIAKAEEEQNALKNDQNYLYNKTRLETVRARVSTGGSYGWIDKNGKFWEGKDASKAFDEAAANEKSQIAKIESKNEEIQSMQNKIKDLQDMLNK
jgi:hypothetical protein